MPVFDPPVRFLRKAIESVRAQRYPHWELCIADDASTSHGVRRLLAAYETSDPRITVVRRAERGHISAAANDAIAVATGTHLAFVDHDDELAADALDLVTAEVARHPDAVLVYTDEDKLDRRGRRHSPHFKPDWDPDLMLGHNFVNHLTVLRTDVVRAAGGLRRGFEGSQDYDLLLRVTERTGPSQIRHLPFVCYHWRQHPASAAGDPAAKPYKDEAARRALAEHLQRLGRTGDVEPAWAGSHWHRVRHRTVGQPSVTVIVPTRDGAGLDRCLGSLLSRTEFDDMEVCVVDNGSRRAETHDLLDGLRAAGRIRVIEDPRPFNYSALNNRAVAETDGDLVVLLNDDTEVIEGGWLGELVSQGQQPGVGAVGAKLLYPDARVQHAGIVVGLGGSAGHLYLGYPGDSLGHDGQLRLVRRVTAATAACLLVPRTAYLEVGGLDESTFAVGFSDVDFCLRLRAAGYHVVWSPYAELYHHESLTRGSGESGPARELRWAQERHALRARWGADLLDPAFSPNLSLDHLYPRLSRQPRVGRLPAPGPGRSGGGEPPSPSR
jgi:GT2 family glycosyltransferase